MPELPTDSAALRLAHAGTGAGALRDRRLAALVRQSPDALALALEVAPVLAMMLDAAEAVVWVNREAERVLGWRLEEMRGRNMLAELCPERELYLRGVALIRHELPAGTDLRLRVRSGGRVETRWSAARLPDGGTVLFGQDVSEPRSLAAAVAAHEERAASGGKLEAIGRFAGGIAHDFNNLLTAIRCGTGFLLSGLRTDDPLREDAVEIERAAARAATLVRQLLAFGRRQVLQPTVLDLNVIVGDMETMLRRIMGGDVEVATSFETSLPLILADAAQMEQIIMNLAVNARDAMPDGGAIVISTERDDAGAATVLADRPEPADRGDERPPQRFVRLTVADTGNGMDEATRARAFEPFFTTKDGEGTGLGLSTVYGIVAQSGGTIEVESAMGRGTRVTIRLPAIDPAMLELYELPGAPAASAAGAGTAAPAGHRTPPRAAPPRPRPDHDAPLATVLLVEDDAAVRMLTARILRCAGYVVFEARDAGEALDRWRASAHVVDVLVTDIRMPGGDGVALADELRADRGALPVVLMSGYTERDPADLRLATDPGATLFLAKPFTADVLTGTVDRALAGVGAG